MMTQVELEQQVKYLMNSEGQPTDVLVPIAVWKQLLADAEVNKSVPENAEPLDIDDDPLAGLFSGSKDLAEKSEEILAEEIQLRSGWSWKSS